MLLNKIIIITLVVILIAFLAISREIRIAKVEEYRKYLKTLDAEGVLKEYFKAKNEKDILKLNETVVDEYKTSYDEQKNLEELEILEIRYSEDGTKLFVKDLNDKGIGFVGAKTFDVTYYVKYKKDKVQDSGEHIWRYNLIKINDETPWVIESYGFW